MTRYIALLRGVNVGGNNIIAMATLKKAFENQGFANVVTYINSGNVIFDSDLHESIVQSACEELIDSGFGLKIAVGVISVAELCATLAIAPDWWNNEINSKHNAIFVIPPLTAEAICTQIGEIKPEYEKIAYHGKVIFWSAPLATFSRTRLTKIVHSKIINNSITVRNANTALKLAALAGETK